MNFEHTDNLNNKITCIGGKVIVKLANEKYTRRIGIISREGDYIKGYPNKLNPKKHKFRINDGWGVNYNVVQKLNDEAYIYLHTINKSLRIKVSDIKTNKDSIKKFAKKGFEIQYIIPENLWEKIWEN